MYPQSELTRLAVYKAARRRDIAVRRAQCAGAAARIVRPLVRVDRAVALWREISPFAQMAALPLALLIRRTLFPREKILGTLWRWGPGALGAVLSLVRR